MAVLIEAISVVVRREAIENRFYGGTTPFERAIPTAASCHDDQLFCVGFMDSSDANAYVTTLEAAGLIYEQNGSAADISFVDQRNGPALPSPWLEFRNVEFNGMKLSLCWAAGSKPRTVNAPPNWKYEGSLSATGGGFMPLSAIGERMKFLRRRDNVDVYLDLQTNKEMYVGRPQISGDTEPALLTQIKAILFEVLALEEKGPVPAPRFWKRRDPRHIRLNDELLPSVKRIVAGPGKKLMAAHFTQGIIERVLGRFAKAENAFRQAHALEPESILPLRDLVRCLGEQGRPKDALPFARKAVEIDPVDVGALGNLAAALMQCGEIEEAQAVIDRALEIEPGDRINLNIKNVLLSKKTKQ